MNAADLCPCGFDRIGDMYSVQWHRDHQHHHLAVFPHVDQGTRDNLAWFIVDAERRSAVAG